MAAASEFIFRETEPATTEFGPTYAVVARDCTWITYGYAPGADRRRPVSAGLAEVLAEAVKGRALALVAGALGVRDE